jgi:hypothetical protein
MPADLSHTRLKLARAKKDFDVLAEKVAAYMDPAPHRAVIETDGNKYTARIYIDREPDPEWGLDVGSIAIQARSALDLLVRQLVIDSGNEPGRTRTQFPIFLDHDGYVRKGRGGSSQREKMLKGVATRHRRIIGEYQPYQRGQRAEDHPLAILAAIANRDKHRDVHAALGAIASSTYRLIKPDGSEVTIAMDSESHRPYMRITDGEVLLAIKNDPSPAAPEERVELDIGEIKTEVVFEGDCIITLADMDRAILQVAEIVERFAKRVKP